MNSTLALEISSFCVAPQGFVSIPPGGVHFLRGANLCTPRALPQECYRIPSGRNSRLLRAIRALRPEGMSNLNISDTTYFVQNKSEAP